MFLCLGRLTVHECVMHILKLNKTKGGTQLYYILHELCYYYYKINNN